jgi:hypothetical protein
VRTRSAGFSSFRAASLLLLVLPLLVAACGSSSAADKQARVECETRAENQAAYEVARSAFNAGSLGGSGSLASYFKGVEKSVYLDGQDRLRPWSDLAQRTEARFDAEEWMGHLEGSGAAIGDRMHDARLRVRNKNTANC